MPDFVKFSGDDERTTWEHISQYVAQLGEAGRSEILRVRLFSLSLTGTAFVWLSSLTPGSINSWGELEHKFHDHFCSGTTELRIGDLTTIRQGRDESVCDYIKKFKEAKNRCFNLADLCFRGLRSHIREKIEGHEYFTIPQVLIRVVTAEKRLIKEKESSRPHRSNMHFIEYDSDSSTDDGIDVYGAEFTWPSTKKALSCSALKPAHKSRQDELKFTFDVSKCDRIFDKLYKLGYIKVSHVIPPMEELKKHAYCKYHNSFSHATNDCNVFRRQVQSAISEGRLNLCEM